jgi:hypothetical protein
VERRLDGSTPIIAESRVVSCDALRESVFAPLGKRVAADGCVAFCGLSGTRELPHPTQPLLWLR